jgi:hypothetical protein
VWVLTRSTVALHATVTYPPGAKRSIFSCQECGLDGLKTTLERNLKAPVVIEADEIGSKSIQIRWDDQASLITTLQNRLGGDLRREERPYAVWVVTALAAQYQPNKPSTHSLDRINRNGVR